MANGLLDHLFVKHLKTWQLAVLSVWLLQTRYPQLWLKSSTWSILYWNAWPWPKYLKHIPLFQLRAAWIIPFFCYQIFDFALNTLVAVSIVVYPNTIQDYLQQLVSVMFFCFFFQQRFLEVSFFCLSIKLNLCPLCFSKSRAARQLPLQRRDRCT